jgi:hypothetical protein
MSIDTVFAAETRRQSGGISRRIHFMQTCEGRRRVTYKLITGTGDVAEMDMVMDIRWME